MDSKMAEFPPIKRKPASKYGDPEKRYRRLLFFLIGLTFISFLLLFVLLERYKSERDRVSENWPESLHAEVLDSLEMLPSQDAARKLTRYRFLLIQAADPIVPRERFTKHLDRWLEAARAGKVEVTPFAAWLRYYVKEVQANGRVGAGPSVEFENALLQAVP